MPRLTSLGIKVGARKVDCERYLPDVGDWEETNVLWDFGNGWLICEDRTPYDRKLMAKLTLTCLGSGELYEALWPGDSRPDDAYWAAIAEDLRAQTHKSYDTKYYRDYHGKKWDSWIEKMVKNLLENKKRLGRPPSIYRIGHVRDPKGRPRAAILLGLAKYCEGSAASSNVQGRFLPYRQARDLAQEHPIVLDKLEWHVLECRIGTGNGAPAHIMSRVCQWYAEATGKWDEKAYKSHNPQHYGKYVDNSITPEVLTKLKIQTA